MIHQTTTEGTSTIGIDLGKSTFHHDRHGCAWQDRVAPEAPAWAAVPADHALDPKPPQQPRYMSLQGF